MIELEGVYVGRLKGDFHRVLVNPNDPLRATTVDLPCEPRTRAGGFGQRPSDADEAIAFGSRVKVVIEPVEDKS